jgi:Ca2+-binding EF-hand superfamily protein
MKSILFGGAAAAAIFLGGAAIPQTAQPAQPVQPTKADKVTTRADVQSHVGRFFSRVDTNRDGYVTKAETDALQAQHTAKIQQRAEKRAQRHEPAKIFGRLDANSDGKITRQEADAAHQARMQAKGGRPARAHATAFGGLFERVDANKDGVITRAEFDAVPKPERAGMRQAGMRRAFGGRMFETADANKDGRVSLAEAQQSALQHFDRADLNRDGKLTREERRQAHQQLRGQRQPS